MKDSRKKRTGANSQPHDVFFRSVMKDVRVARDLIRACLPEDLLAVTDLDGLEWQKRDYTNTVRTESEIDVLYRTKISGMEAFLYVLLEHQARPDPLMPFRILYYTFLILRRKGIA